VQCPRQNNALVFAELQNCLLISDLITSVCIDEARKNFKHSWKLWVQCTTYFFLSVEGDGRSEREQKLDTWKCLAITHAQLFIDGQIDGASIRRSKENQDEDERLHSALMPVASYNMQN
ncbi:hypothetical protein JG687_00014940, partial [Phytophthora cactorum]